MNMQWSIYKNSSLPYEQWEECHSACFIDHDMETSSPFNRVKFLHDGVYPIYYGKNSVHVVVKDGKFEDVGTMKAKIGDLVEMAGYWGSFIEGFEKRDGSIHVRIGS